MHNTKNSGDRAPRLVLNAAQLVHRVAKACHWSDGGSEFVFVDGTVMAFQDDMQTFVAASAAEPKKPKDMMLTSLALSQYIPKVKAALAVYNRYSPRPRLIHGLCEEEERLWASSTPIESVVLAEDVSLFQREWVWLAARDVGGGAANETSMLVVDAANDSRPMPETDGVQWAETPTTATSSQSPVVHATPGDAGATRQGKYSYRMVLWCAMRKVRLTVHPSREVFTVVWPARVAEADGSNSIFVSPINERGDYIPTTHGLATQRTCRYIMQEQQFFVDDCPREWSEMLALCFRLDGLANSEGQERRSELSGERSGSGMCSSTPAPLGAPRVPSSSSYLNNRFPELAASMSSSSIAATSIRFSELMPEDTHSFVASSQIHNCPCQSRLHPSFTNRNVNVLWRYDADPSGRTPQAFFRVNPEGAQDGTCMGWVAEDECVIRATLSQALAPASAAGVVRMELKRIVAMGRSARCGDVIPSQISLEVRHLMQDTTLSVPLPRTINTGLSLPLLGVVGSHVAQLCCAADDVTPAGGDEDRKCLQVSLDPMHAAEEHGRYLPCIAESLVSLMSTRRSSDYSKRLSETVVHPQNSPSLIHSRGSGGMMGVVDHNTTTASAVNNESVEARAEKLTSRIDGVGSFTALSNGVVRGAFDDRVILTLIPDATDSDEGLVCEMRGRDAELLVCRVSQCMLETHPASPYLAYLLPFRLFSRMRPEDQRSWANVKDHNSRYEYAMTSTITAVDKLVLNASADISLNQSLREQAKALLSRV